MVDPLPRLRPSPLPSINPVPEYLADDALKRVYEKTKLTLQVPWMGVVTMAFAHYPSFFDTLWGGLSQLAGSREFVEACRALRVCAEDAALQLEPRSIVYDLAELGYAEREIEDIRALNEVFSHGNMPYLMIATAARLLLEGHSLSERGSSSPFEGRHGPSTENRLALMEAHHVDAPTIAVYDEIKATLGLPFINTDYRAFARWPSYFAVAWRDLAEKVPNEAYEARLTDVHDFAAEQIRALPNPGGLTSEILINAAEQDGTADEITEVVRLFQWLLPGLVVNVAFLRHQLSIGA